MRVLIVDDERLARERLRRLLEGVAGCVVAGEAATGSEALDTAERMQPDVVLLDIAMPGMTGIDAADRLLAMESPPVVIFVTAHDEFALDAFRAQAVDYLLKPVRRAQLERALAHASRPNRVQLAALKGRAGTGFGDRHLTVRVPGGLHRVPLTEIICLIADQKYVAVVTAAGEYLTEESLKHLQQRYGDLFVRVHRNALVSLSRVEAFEQDGRGGFGVRLRGLEEAVPVSRRHLPGLRRLLRERD